MLRCLYSSLYFFSLFGVLQAQTPKVLYIGIDGCRTDALEAAATPNIDALIANGIYSPDGLNDDVTVSGPGWSAIMCGVWSPKHGVTNNSFSGSNYANYPSFFQLAENTDPSLHTASIVHWNPINDQIVGAAADFSQNVANDQELKDATVAYLTNNDPDLLFIHFDEVDDAGHASGFTPDNAAYINVIQEVDAHIGDILTALEARPNYANEDWLFILTPDHGGFGTSHGGTSLEEELVFGIVSGNNVNVDTIRRDSQLVSNMAPNCLGDTIALDFSDANDRVVIPNASEFNFGANQDFSIECRVRTSQAADVAIVGNKDWDSGLNKGFVFSFKFASGPEWKVNIGDGSNRADINTGGAIADGQWHTLSVTFDRDGMMSMYEDGVFVIATDISSIGDITTNAGLFFGTDINNAFDYNGYIAEVRVWDGVLAPGSIADWHCKPLESSHPEYANVLGYWPLNEGSGVVATDASFNGHDGTIIGAEWMNTESIVVYDFSNTHRLVDLPVTALTHVCVPILASWDLDGQSMISTCDALPVSWLEFTATARSSRQVTLQWITADEWDNAGFQVERSIDGRSWETISSTIQPREDGNYVYWDNLPKGGHTFFYRIKQLDLGGTYSYSTVQSVSIEEDFDGISLYPNPSGEFLNILFDHPFEAPKAWKLVNAQGQTVLNGQIASNSEEVSIRLAGIVKGMYWLGIDGYKSRVIIKE